MSTKLRRISILAVAATVAMIVPAAASAADLTVNDDTTGPGPAGATCATPDHATLSGALAAAQPGDRILVCAGEYSDLANAGAKADLQILGPQAGVDARTRPDDESQEAVVTGHLSANNTTGLVIDGLKFRRDPADPNPTGSRIQMSGNNTGDYLVANNIITDSNIGLNMANSGIGDGVIRQNAIFGTNSSGITATAPNVQRMRIVDNDIAGNPSVIFNPQINNNPVGGLDLEVTGNRMSGSGNAAVVYKSRDVTIADNEVVGSGTAFVLGGAVDGAVVSGNTVTERGTAVWVANQFGFGPNEDIQVTGNDLVDSTSNGVLVGANSYSGVLPVHANRMVGDAGTNGVSNQDAQAEVDASDNWWGCNDGPGSAGCTNVSGSVDFDPWLVLSLDGPTATGVGDTESYDATLLGTSSGDPAAQPGAFPQTEVAFGASAGSIDSPQDLVASIATTELTAPNANGPIEVTATLDDETVALTVIVSGAPLQETSLDARPMVLDNQPSPIRLVTPIGRFTANLTDPTTGAPIEGKEIVFSSQGEELCRNTTSANGEATCAVNLGEALIPLLRLGYTASFAGDFETEAASDDGGLIRLLDLLEL